MTKLGTDLALHLPLELGTDLAGGGGGGPPPVDPTMYGVQGFSTADFYQTALPGGIAGTAAGFWVSCLLRLDALVVANRSFLGRFTTGAGWIFTVTSAHNLIFQLVDGGGVIRASANFPVTAVAGKIMHVAAVFDGAALRLHVNRSQVGAPTALSGFTVANERMLAGKRATGSATTSGTMFGVCGGHAVPTLAEVEAQADAIKLAGDIVAIPGKTDSLWSVKQDQAGTAPAVLDDKVGLEDMAAQGAPALVSDPAPVWGW